MTITSQQLFDELVANAIDFLSQSISDLKVNPKYSVINFCVSVELFLKARLMAEHWTLIFDDPKNANKTKFSDGDFKSININDAIGRLRNIAHVKISDTAETNFEKLRQHRNKLIHFFHPEYSNQINKKIQEDIAAEQLNGWLDLHRLLVSDWKVVFDKYLGDIDKLNGLMYKHRAFLQTKFNRVFPDIKKGMKRDVIFLVCKSCGFEASRIAGDENPIITTTCMVCENQDKYLKTPCSNCKENIFVYDLGKGTCENCQTEIGLDYVVKVFQNKEFSGESRAYCSECEHIEQPTAIQLDYDKWLCLFCLSMEDQAGRCDWCSELVTGDTTVSYFSGCVKCDGRDGWKND